MEQNFSEIISVGAPDMTPEKLTKNLKTSISIYQKDMDAIRKYNLIKEEAERTHQTLSECILTNASANILNNQRQTFKLEAENSLKGNPNDIFSNYNFLEFIGIKIYHFKSDSPFEFYLSSSEKCDFKVSVEVNIYKREDDNNVIVHYILKNLFSNEHYDFLNVYSNLTNYSESEELYSNCIISDTHPYGLKSHIRKDSKQIKYNYVNNKSVD